VIREREERARTRQANRAADRLTAEIEVRVRVLFFFSACV
jgi:hypothetical protein